MIKSRKMRYAENVASIEGLGKKKNLKEKYQ
jgi:hypothetical protein